MLLDPHLRTMAWLARGGLQLFLEDSNRQSLITTTVSLFYIPRSMIPSTCWSGWQIPLTIPFPRGLTRPLYLWRGEKPQSPVITDYLWDWVSYLPLHIFLLSLASWAAGCSTLTNSCAFQFQLVFLNSSHLTRISVGCFSSLALSIISPALCLCRNDLFIKL